MQWLAAICVKRPVFASVIVLVFVVIGIAGYNQLCVDRFPKVNAPTVTITTALAGARRVAVIASRAHLPSLRDAPGGVFVRVGVAVGVVDMRRKITKTLSAWCCAFWCPPSAE